MTLWKKKMKVEDKQKVFCISGGYSELKKALLERGWFHNKDPSSPCYDLKWVLKGKDINFGDLGDNQIVNHFDKATNITTKVGLHHSLKNLIWFNNVDIDQFWPRDFDMRDKDERVDFVEEFQATKAESILKLYSLECQAGEIKMSEKKVKTALAITNRRLMDLDDLIDAPV
jgi:hypothetical protein